jgi:hypothetical protein
MSLELRLRIAHGVLLSPPALQIDFYCETVFVNFNNLVRAQAALLSGTIDAVVRPSNDAEAEYDRAEKRSGTGQLNSPPMRASVAVNSERGARATMAGFVIASTVRKWAELPSTFSLSAIGNASGSP